MQRAAGWEVTLRRNAKSSQTNSSHFSERAAEGQARYATPRHASRYSRLPLVSRRLSSNAQSSVLGMKMWTRLLRQTEQSRFGLTNLPGIVKTKRGEERRGRNAIREATGSPPPTGLLAAASIQMSRLGQSIRIACQLSAGQDARQDVAVAARPLSWNDIHRPLLEKDEG